MSKNNDTTQAFLEAEAALEKALADQGRLEKRSDDQSPPICL